MKKISVLALTLIVAGITGFAQQARTLKKVMELKMPLSADDDMPGTRGASVAWNPVLKKYYASFAGNSDYPMAVFDATGKRISTDDLKTMADTRGLWFNAASKKVCGNGYDETGWFSYTLGKNGIPEEVAVDQEGMNQPDAQSVGTYNPLAKKVLFFHGGQVYMYSNDAELQDSVMIHWNRKQADGPGDDEDPSVTPEDYNYTSVVFTGVKGQELGFLNITNKEVELYDLRTGYMKAKLSLPETASTEAAFNFAFANGIYWLFNIETRKWIGYK